MKKSHFRYRQNLAILQQAQSGVPAPELCREHIMENSTFYYLQRYKKVTRLIFYFIHI